VVPLSRQLTHLSKQLLLRLHLGQHLQRWQNHRRVRNGWRRVRAVRHRPNLFERSVPMKIALALLCLASCASTTSPPTLETTSRQQFPMTVRWEVTSRTERGVTLAAHVTRLTALPLTFHVVLDVPAGAKLESGRQKFDLLPNTEGVEIVETYSVLFDTLPAEDLLLHVDGDGQNAGYHAKVPYRFGRAEPTAAPVDATGPAPAGKGGRPVGNSVPLKTP
jgi:hypothetical protein